MSALEPHLRRLRSVEHGGLRLIWGSDGQHELFDLRGDPREVVDLAGSPERADREARLHELLEEFVERGGGPRPLPKQAQRLAPAEGSFGGHDPEMIERLRELGYVE